MAGGPREGQQVLAHSEGPGWPGTALSDHALGVGGPGAAPTVAAAKFASESRAPYGAELREALRE